VAEAVAFSIPDPVLGETVGAAVVPKCGQGVTAAALKKHVSGRLAYFKVPARLWIVDEIPKGPTGKIQRIGMSDRLKGMAAADDTPAAGEYEPPVTPTETVLAGYVGRLRRSVAVETDDAPGRFAELILTVDIPEPVDINPRFLLWRVGDRAEEKSLEIVVTEPNKTVFGEIECSSPLFHARLLPQPAGGYRLAVEPVDLRQPAEAIIHLPVTIAGRPQMRLVYVAVK
jgi:hypothetical protein